MSLTDFGDLMRSGLQAGGDHTGQFVEILLSLGPEEIRGIWARWRPQSIQQREGMIRWAELCVGIFSTVSDEDARTLLRCIGPIATAEELSQAWAALRGRLPRLEFFALVGRPCRPIAIDWRMVPEGMFWMGAPGRTSDSWETPRHPVSLASFEIAATPITRGQRAMFWKTPRLRPEEAELPVGSVSWCEAWLLCEWLGAALPTEAQWERACRAGTMTRWSNGDLEASLREVGWFVQNAREKPHLVGLLRPNGFGIYDMHGNVMEWCADSQRVYSGGLMESPGQDMVGDGRVRRDALFRTVRGGYYNSPPSHCRSAHRAVLDVFSRFDGLGVRPVRSQ
ncbi:MAG: formylglycine-generating enzyme family protein [Myxococcota bacterium]